MKKQSANNRVSIRHLDEYRALIYELKLTGYSLSEIGEMTEKRKQNVSSIIKNYKKHL